LNVLAADPPSFPTTLDEWERILTRSLLHGEDGNADAIRSFEVTPETLAAACGQGTQQATAAERAFRRALKSDRLLNHKLQYGVELSKDPDVPQCMAVLALTLLIDTLIDGDYEDTGAFRAKLALWLHVDHSFANLQGVALMWERLVVWLNRRVAAGASFRRLVLPDIPSAWTHIGYTRYLSFPTRRDRRFLARTLTDHPEFKSDASALIRWMDLMIQTASVSYGLRTAFADFRRLFRAGGASVDHRFWRLVASAKASTAKMPPAWVDCWMEFDEDGHRSFRLRSSNGSAHELARDFVSVAQSPAVLKSPNLGPAIRRGVLFFRSSGLARWTASGETPTGHALFHFATLDRHYRLAANLTTRFRESGGWLVTIHPISATTILDFLNRLGIHGSAEQLRTIRLVDGVRVGSAWLGLPRYLPRIEGSTGSIQITPVFQSASSAAPTLVDDALCSPDVVEGAFMLIDTLAEWSQRAAFTPCADVHVSSGTNRALTPIAQEWRCGRLRQHSPITLQIPAWDPHPFPLQDLLEALYASGRSGIGEGDAIALIQRAESARSWEVLRTLQESTFVDAHFRERWRGRDLTLAQPTLTEMQCDGQPIVVASGAIPLRLEKDFRETVTLQGGQAFRHIRIGSLAPPLLGAVDVEPHALAAALGWTVTAAGPLLDGRADDRLCETSVIGAHYTVASTWDWSVNRFRAGMRASRTPSLTRYIHPDGRDHDLYRVQGRQCRTFLSRHAAIIDLHAQAHTPMFRYQNGLLTRIPNDGALPVELARELRLKSLQNGGACDIGWSYCLPVRDAQWVASLLGDLILFDGTNLRRDETAMHRRGRGRRRALWSNGALNA
jgi:hypothetical protein